MFKTQYEGYDEYPETGIEDSNFPHGKKETLFKTLWIPLHQMTYPVTKLLNKNKKPETVSA